jgi:hypothetical protein
VASHKQVSNDTDQPATRLKVKVVPAASRSQLAGWLGDALKIRVSAPPEKGKANAAVEAVLAEALGLPAGSVAVVSGKSSPRKLVEVRGLSREEIVKRLAVGSY